MATLMRHWSQSYVSQVLETIVTGCKSLSEGLIFVSTNP